MIHANNEHSQLYQRLQAYSVDVPRAQFSFSQRLARENGWSTDYAQRVIDECGPNRTFSDSSWVSAEKIVIGAGRWIDPHFLLELESVKAGRILNQAFCPV